MNPILQRRRLGTLRRESVPLILQVAPPMSDRNTEKTFWVPRFEKASFSYLPVSLSREPFVLGRYVKGEIKWVPFDFGRFIDALEVEDGHLRKANGVDSLQAKIGPLGRQTVTLTRGPTEEDLGFISDSVSNRMRIGGLIGANEPPEVGSFWESCRDWELETEAIRACLAVFRFLKESRQDPEAFRNSFVRVDGTRVFRPRKQHLTPFGAMNVHTLQGQIARSFLTTVSQNLGAKADAEYMKRFDSRKMSTTPNRHEKEIENSRSRYHTWWLLQQTISCYLEGQVSGEVRLLKDPTKIKGHKHGTPAGFSNLRPRTLAGIMWLSLIHFINGSLVVERCSVCGKRYSLAGRQLNARSKKYIDPKTGTHIRYCGREVSRRCGEVVRKEYKGAKKA